MWNAPLQMESLRKKGTSSNYEKQGEMIQCQQVQGKEDNLRTNQI